MKKLAVMLIGFTVGLGGQAAAQGPAERLAYVSCQSDYWYGGDGVISCFIGIEGIAGISDGTEPAWSPDGSRLAYVGYSQGGLFVLNLEDGSVANLGGGSSPTWSPDGLKIAFSGGELYVMDADGSSPTPLTNNVGFAGLPAWSRDGRIVFDCVVESGNGDICAINADGTGLVRLTTDPAWDTAAAPSPVDSRIAFLTTRYGDYREIAIMNADGSGVSRLGIGASDFAWLPDGTRIGFVQEEGMACEADGRICPPSIGIVNLDGTGAAHYGYGWHPAWTSSLHPFASVQWQGCYGLTCTFDGGTSWGGRGITNYAWDFGDGTSDSGATVNHTYPAAGEFTVALTVTDSVGATNTQRRIFNVGENSWPIASFTYDCNGPRCTLDGSGSSDLEGPITRYHWIFGDGSTSGSYTANPTTTRTYATGTFSVTLIVSDGAAIGRLTRSLTVVNALPIARFTSTCTGLTCAFDGSASSDEDGEIQSFAWQLGNDYRSSPAVLNYTFAAPGTYTVTLSVRDDANQMATHTETVTVGNAPPLASFMPVCSGRTCTFTGSGSDADGTVASYMWSFGDGTAGSGQAATHSYAAWGTYTITLTVTDNGGATGTQSKTVSLVNPPPVASFTLACSGRTCHCQRCSVPQMPTAPLRASRGISETGPRRQVRRRPTRTAPRAST